MELNADNLACERGGRLVFEGVDFSLQAGELMELTGPNGSGKSSLLRLVAGLGEPSRGGISLEGGHPELSIGQQCHYIAHQDAIKLALTVAENLAFWHGYLGGGNCGQALAAFALERLSNHPAQLLSAGQKRRLSLARLALVPRLLWLLDEPTVGLDAASQARLFALISSHLESGGMVIAATHVPLAVPAAVKLALGGERLRP
jgi:heme exporter protein A